jgi:predicted nuclease with TOPRIM domain
MTLIDKLDRYIESENADADMYFDEFPPEAFKEALLKLHTVEQENRFLTEMSGAQEALNGMHEKDIARLQSQLDSREKMLAHVQNRLAEVTRENARLSNELCDRADRLSEMGDRLDAIRKHIEVSCPTGYQMSTVWQMTKLAELERAAERQRPKISPICNACWGSGWERQFVTPCPDCKGTGVEITGTAAASAIKPG